MLQLSLQDIKRFVDEFFTKNGYCKTEGPWQELYFDRLKKMNGCEFEICYGYLEMYESVEASNKYLSSLREIENSEYNRDKRQLDKKLENAIEVLYAKVDFDR